MAQFADGTTDQANASFRPRSFGIDRSTLIQYALYAFTIVLVLGPISPIIYQSFVDRPLYDTGQQYTLDNYIRLLSSPVFLEAIWNTLVFALLSTLIGTSIGVIAAILIGRTNMPGRRFLSGLLLWPIFISHLVMAFGWFIVYGPAGYITLMIKSVLGVEPWNLYSLGGMSLIAGVSIAPLTFLYCSASTALSEATLEDAARTCGSGPFRTLWAVTLPLLLPAIFYSIILNFTGALEMLAIPLVFGEPAGINLFATLLYTQGFAAARPDYGIVSTAALFLIVVIFLLLTLQRRMLRNSRRFVTVGGKASRRRTVELGLFRWPAFLLLFTYAVIFIGVPLGILFLRASVSVLTPLAPFWHYFTSRHIVAAFSYESNIRAIVNTLVIAALGAAIGTFFVAMITVVVHRSQFRFHRSFEYVALLPRAIPGLVASMGFFYAMVIIPPMGWLRSTIWILMLAYIMRFIPLAFGALSPSLMQIGKELDSSARVIGADWWRTTRTIVLPLMKPAMFSSFALIFVFCLKEYTTAVFLFTPGNEVLGASLLLYWANGNMGMVAMLSTVQIILTMFFIYGARSLFGVKFGG
ncbi:MULTISPECIES: iron ABC transporter permease [unclassified Shinella]|uniref:ABC transporter permease n=1 Tax=unclassified Shinella TaxID=2643062 RepID=UPI00225DC840|nr:MULTISPECIES: iron ABC transporter permease [unclassified Shinella]MCO5136424.1 iron ABC transporter permease [Shinella sp.]MDC7253899.1 iron ABC transporter permease [Shinella sp. YE25]CAI0336552.1 Iron(III) transport system permease protein [Rhizobiaceae bacterium]CAK7255086.1 iron(III) transport system permease protein [Shinella sp. WSC3-e]